MSSWLRRTNTPKEPTKEEKLKSELDICKTTNKQLQTQLESAQEAATVAEEKAKKAEEKTGTEKIKEGAVTKAVAAQKQFTKAMGNIGRSFRKNVPENPQQQQQLNQGGGRKRGKKSKKNRKKSKRRR